MLRPDSQLGPFRNRPACFEPGLAGFVTDEKLMACFETGWADGFETGWDKVEGFETCEQPVHKNVQMASV